MPNDYFINRIREDWPSANLAVLKFCKEQADTAVLAHTNVADYPYLQTPHLSVYRGVSRWVILDYFMEVAAKDGLFAGITPRWEKYRGAPILELRGKNTSLTACHVLNRDDKPSDSRDGYRSNNRAKNQKNLELFSQFESTETEDPLHILFVHGGANETFGFLRIFLEDSDFPVVTGNIMEITTPDQDQAEVVSRPIVTLNSPNAPQPAPTPQLSVRERQDEYSPS